MKKSLKILLVLLLVVVAAVGGTLAYYRFSKSPKAVAARTLRNLQEVDSVAFKMEVDAGVKAEVGFLKFLGLDNTETTVTMNYDIDWFKEPAMLDCNLSVNAFDIDALKDVRILVVNENDETARYYYFKNQWYKLPSDIAEEAVDESGATDDSEVDSSVGSRSIGADTDSSVGSGADGSQANVAFVKVDPSVIEKAISENAVLAAFSQKSESTENHGNSFDMVDFEALLEGYETGEITMEMRKETETVNDKECFVYDVDLTGDMFEKVIKFSGGGKGLIPKLKASEHVTGQFYIDKKESLPVSLTLTTGDIFSDKLAFDQINAVLSVTKIDLDVDVEGYNIEKTGSVPTEYTDLTDMKGMSAKEWIDFGLDLTGLGDFVESITN